MKMCEDIKEANSANIPVNCFLTKPEDSESGK